MIFDVFLSYAREDRERARTIASAIEAQGWSVWWDRKIVAGQAFDRAIETQLESTRAVVVLWSIHSVVSDWVRNEAALASEREVLVPVLIDDVKQPLEFRRRQAADLTTWTGDTFDPEFQALYHGLAAKCGPPGVRTSDGRTSEIVVRGPEPRPAALMVPVPAPGTPAPPPVERSRGTTTRTYLMAACVVALVALAWVAGSMRSGRSENAALSRQPDPVAQTGNPPVSPIVRPAAASIGADPILKSRTMDGTAGRSADNPTPVDFDVITRMRLGANEEAHLRLAAPISAIDVIMDMRLVENEISNLIASLSMTDENGGVIRESLIGLNEINRQWRATATFTSDRPARLGLRLVNGSKLAEFWVTVRAAGATGLVPFMGEVRPQAIALDETFRGKLVRNETAFFHMAMEPGEYDAILDFERQPREPSNIIGSLWRRDAAGGNAVGLIGLNQIGASYRKVVRFSVERAGLVIFQAQNQAGVVTYALRSQHGSALTTTA